MNSNQEITLPIYQFGVKGKRGFNCVAILPIKTNESSCVKSFARQALPVLSVNAKYIGCLHSTVCKGVYGWLEKHFYKMFASEANCWYFVMKFLVILK